MSPGWPIKNFFMHTEASFWPNDYALKHSIILSHGSFMFTHKDSKVISVLLNSPQTYIKREKGDFLLCLDNLRVPKVLHLDNMIL